MSNSNVHRDVQFNEHSLSPGTDTLIFTNLLSTLDIFPFVSEASHFGQPFYLQKDKSNQEINDISSLFQYRKNIF